MSDTAPSGVPQPLARALCEFAMLPVADERLDVLALALNEVLSSRAALSTLDLTDVEPVATFDARWD